MMEVIRTDLLPACQGETPVAFNGAVIGCCPGPEPEAVGTNDGGSGGGKRG
jgi:hypothetical protein